MMPLLIDSLLLEMHFVRLMGTRVIHFSWYILTRVIQNPIGIIKQEFNNIGTLQKQYTFNDYIVNLVKN